MVKILLKLVWLVVKQSAGVVFVAGLSCAVRVEDGAAVVHIED
jgi:hypothetical protein